MNVQFKLKDYKKKIDGINYECEFSEEEVICSEYGDNPHGINNEVRCGLKEFLDKLGENANRYHSFIRNYFGEKKLHRFILFIQKQQQSYTESSLK